VIFICHSLGGLVLKAVLDEANQNATGSTGVHVSSADGMQDKCRSLLSKTKAIVFYGTPHKGAWGADVLRYWRGGPCVKFLTTFDTNREVVNASFSSIHNCYKWEVMDLAETNETTVGPVSVMIVPLASAFSGLGPLRLIDRADHLKLCKVTGQSDQQYIAAKEVIARFVTDPLKLPRHSAELPYLHKVMVVVSTALNGALGFDGGYNEAVAEGGGWWPKWRRLASSKRFYINLRPLSRKGSLGFLLAPAVYLLGRRHGANRERKRTRASAPTRRLSLPLPF